jgi:hypothetical protein
MKTAEQIAQWVIDNRYPKSENNKVSDREMYHELVESIAKLCAIPRVSNSVFDCPVCGSEWDTDKHNSCKCGAYIGKH